MPRAADIACGAKYLPNSMENAISTNARHLLVQSILAIAAIAPGAASADVWQNETNSALECNYCALQFPPSTFVNITSETIFGRIFEAGITETPGASASVLAQLGVGPAGSDPRTAPGWTWSATSQAVIAGMFLFVV